MTDLYEVAKKTLIILEKIYVGCEEVREDPKTHKEAKILAMLVRKDCNQALEALRQALAIAKEKNT